MNLFCVPFAGGSSYSYKGLQDLDLPSLTITTLELPGRGKRFLEPLLTDTHHLVDDLFGQVKEELEEPYYFYGHSLGGLLAYLLTHRVVEKAFSPPLCLFISGCEAPSVIPRDTRHLLPSLQFRRVLRDFGGSPPGVLENEELMDIFEPILRADFQAFETYRHVKREKLALPIVAMKGDQQDTLCENVEKWRHETEKECVLHQFPGGHFFINEHWEKIADIIRKKGKE
jgi:surfactin synthase thioesterase subunit